MLTFNRKFKGFNINKSNVLLWLEKHFISEDAPDKGREIYAKIKPTDFIFEIISEVSSEKSNVNFLYFINQEKIVKIKISKWCIINNYLCLPNHYLIISDNLLNYTPFLSFIITLNAKYILILYNKILHNEGIDCMQQFYDNFDILEYILSLSKNKENIKYLKRIIFYQFFQSLLYTFKSLDKITDFIEPINQMFFWFNRHNYISNNKIIKTLLNLNHIILIKYYYMFNSEEYDPSLVISIYDFCKKQLEPHLNWSENKFAWISSCIRFANRSK